MCSCTTFARVRVFVWQIREKTQYGTPWRQYPRSRMSPDTEVKQIMTPRSSGVGARPKTALPQEANSPGEHI